MTRFLALTLAGLAIGSIYALVSLGVVVLYRISRVVNLAHGAMGIFATFVFHYELVGRLHLPVGVAFAGTLLVGAVLGVVGAKVVSALANWPTIVPPDAIFLAITFSAAVGIFFGFYPARKAARLDPIQALRYE
jgi:branched-subunit amino acid ABC-type transport system permease component